MWGTARDLALREGGTVGQRGRTVALGGGRVGVAPAEKSMPSSSPPEEWEITAGPANHTPFTVTPTRQWGEGGAPVVGRCSRALLSPDFASVDTGR